MKIIEVSFIQEVEETQIEMAAKVAAYQAAQAHQLQHGGPGPVADYETMAIVNEHNGEFQVIAKQEEIIQEPISDQLIEK
jgi:hypothetical protein